MNTEMQYSSVSEIARTFGNIKLLRHISPSGKGASLSFCNHIYLDHWWIDEDDNCQETLSSSSELKPLFWRRIDSPKDLEHFHKLAEEAEKEFWQERKEYLSELLGPSSRAIKTVPIKTIPPGGIFYVLGRKILENNLQSTDVVLEFKTVLRWDEFFDQMSLELRGSPDSSTSKVLTCKSVEGKDMRVWMRSICGDRGLPEDVIVVEKK